MNRKLMELAEKYVAQRKRRMRLFKIGRASCRERV